MKRVLFFCAAALLSTLTYAGTDPAPGTKQVNIEKSVVTWKGYKVLGSHTGTIQVSEGELTFDDEGLTGGNFMIDMSSLACTDLEAGKGKEKLEGHLKSDDFFGVNNFPTASFEITNVVSRGKEGEYKIIGNLTIKETTKEIKFNATVKDNQAMADIKVDRSEFDVRYGSGSFFDNLGDNTIYDEFDLTINLVF